MNRQTPRPTTCSSAASTCSCRSRWSTAKRSCRRLWLSCACCSSALTRSRWTDRGEAQRRAGHVLAPVRRSGDFIWVRPGWKLTAKAHTSDRFAKPFICLLAFLPWLLKDGVKIFCSEAFVKSNTRALSPFYVQLSWLIRTCAAPPATEDWI